MWSKNISLLKDFTYEVFKEHGILSNQNSRGKVFMSKGTSLRYKFFSEGYIHDVWFDQHNIVLKGRSYRPQKKNEKPHAMSMAFEILPKLKIVVSLFL